MAPSRMPLEFEANHGQAPTQFDFVAHGQSYTIGISATEIAFTVGRPASTHTVDFTPVAMDLKKRSHADAVEHAQLNLRLLGSNPDSKAEGLQPRESVSNYFIGSDPAKWHTKVLHFGKVQRVGVYRGIDLVFYGNPQELEYDFRVAAGVDPEAIRIAADGASGVAIDGDGDLVLTTSAGDLRLKHPIAYQEIAGIRKAVSSSFSLGADMTIRIKIGAYDRSQPLIIDPVLNYGAAFGGSNGNQALGMDVDASGNVYLTGNSCSSDFPTTAGSFQSMTTDPAIYACQDAFALKLDPTASRVIYADYFGGTGASTGTHVAVDTAGDLFVTGATTSPNFPLSGNIGPSAPQSCTLFQAPQYCPQGFVLKLSPDGSTLAFSTLLGGSQATVGFQLKLNPVTGDVDVLGTTNSLDFKPAMTGPQTTYQGGTCDNYTYCLSGFLVGLDPSSGALRYGTFLGGTGSNFDAGLAFDALGNIYVAGSTQPPLASSLGNVTHTYPPAGGAAAGGMDIFLAQFKLSQSKLSVGYLTLIQGEGDDIPSGLAVDAAGNAYVTGSTASKSLPVTAGSFQTSTTSTSGFGCLWTFSYPPVTCGTIFVSKVDTTGALSFLTYLGGSSTDWGEAIGVDSLGNIWLTAATTSNDFPFTKDAYGLRNSEFNPLLAEMTNDGSALSFASQVAGIFGRATDLKIDSSNSVYLTGYAYAAPTTPGTYSDSSSPLSPLANPLFVQKWTGGPEPLISLSSKALTFGPVSVGAISTPQTVILSNTGAGPLELGIQTVSTSATGSGSSFLESNNCGSVLAPNASCTLTVSLEPFPSPLDCTVANGCAPFSQTAAIVIQNNAPSGTQQITLTGTSGVGPVVAVAPRAITFPSQIAGTSSNPQYVQISNQGDVNLIVASATLSGANASDFQLTNNCTSPLPPGNFNTACQLTIVFSPAASATGNRTATLIIVDNGADSPQSVSLNGSIATTAGALYVFPEPVSFGYTLIGGPTYVAQAVADITNLSSTTTVQITGLTIGGANAADFNLRPGQPFNFPLSLAPGGENEIIFYFNPTSGADGPRTATATLTTNPVIPGLTPIPLQGVAATSTDPAISLYTNPSPMDLGSVQVGQSSQGGSTYLLIGNIGSYCATTPCGGPLIISSIISGLSDYTIVSQPGSPANCATFPVTIPLNGQCGFNAIFAPTQAGPRNTTLTINSNDPDGAQTLTVTGTGLSLPLGNLSATALNFGYAAIGMTSPSLTVALNNVGTSPLTLSGVSASTNFGVQSNGCSGSIAPGASCTIGVNFTPPTAGGFSGTLTVSDNDALGGQQTVALSGIGATGPSLMILPNAMSFGNQAINTVSAAQAITLTNFGDTAISFPANALLITGLTEEFTVTSKTCGTSLALQASCVVELKFNPVVYGANSGTLTITDSARGNPQHVFLTGTGLYATTTTISSSANPSSIGQAITLTATVGGTTNSIPFTGSVTFLNGAAAIGTAAVNGSSQASFTTSSLGAGTNAITAVYSSDMYYAASTSAALSQVVNAANQVNTTTKLSSNLNPSTAGQFVTFTAVVTGTISNTPLPTGTVTFYDGSSVLGSGSLNGVAQATLGTASLIAGSHSITAVYGADANYAASTSTTVTQVVNAPPLVGTTTTLLSSQNPATTSQSITFTATVAGTTSNAPLPTGSVVFYDGTTSLSSGTLNASAQATYTTSSLALGSHSITAAYGSTSTYAASTSTALVQVINAPAKTATSTTLVSSANPAGAGASISFTATVAGVSSITPVPTGTVNLLDGTTIIGTATLTPGGTASLFTTALTQGTHTVTAQYSGDSNYLASSSNTILQVVSAAPGFSFSLSPSTLTLAAGQSGTSTLTIASAGGFSQPVSFACSGLPQFTACSFNPASVTPTANGTVTSTVTITTNVASAALRRHAQSTTDDQTSVAFLSFALVILWRKRIAFANKSAEMIFILVVGLLGAVAASGCGRGVSHLTPAGVSYITITAAAGTVQQTQILSVTVE